ncbi:MAG TPA: VOC family protein [Mycobacteriales bacterium]|nr:VOC family protein [Mycobacteriales bacterium]
MSERTSYLPGVPCWVDLATTDPAGANRFYGELFGWTVHDQGAEFGNYGMAELRGKTVAGIGPVPPGSQSPPAWSTYLASPDIDETVATVKEAGGMVVMGPMDVGDAGRLAFAQDPAGAFVGFWEAKDHPGAQLVNEPGAVAWNELVVRDAAAADRFYQALFGYELEKVDGPPDFDYVLVKVGDDGVAGRYLAGAEVPPEVPPHWLTYFAVEDTDAVAEKITALGGTVVRAPADTPYGRMATCVDPAGATFAIIRLPDQS